MSEEELNSLAGSAEEETPQPEPEGATGEENADSSQEAEATTTETDAESDTQETKSDQGDDKPKGEEEEKPKQSRKEKRFDELTARRREAERKAEAAEKDAQRLRERLKQYETPAPKESDFNSYDEYQAALAAHQNRQIFKQEREADAEDAEERAKNAREEAQRELSESFVEASAEFAARVPDYTEKVNDPTLPITQSMRDEIFASEKGPEIAYYLANNRGEAAQISRLNSPGEVARAIGRIEGRLTLPEPKKVTAAPTPIKTVATGSGSRSGFDPAKEDDFTEHLKAKGVIG